MENVFMDTNPNDFVVLCHSEKPCFLAVRKENSAAKITRYGKDMRRRGVGYVSLHALHMNKTDSLLQHIRASRLPGIRNCIFKIPIYLIA